ncbi:NUDIX domain-containing protein [Demequina globuliformis]|uniref:NUDIX domain-containing protein n=1 Tax=Demequina globuliformis TaxID=676202 RepID=UPI000784DCCE|nr:NUDIX domain-containing protein [Demequina globuliformis]
MHTGHSPLAASGPPPRGPRNAGDAWVTASDGTRYWGRFGAAGILAFDTERGFLMQHRAAWSHHGGTWGIPGGALHQGESALVGALREAYEEAGVVADDVAPRLTWVVDREVWRYTTIVVDVLRPFEPHAGDAESIELAWVPPVEVDEALAGAGARELHPAVAASLPAIMEAMRQRPHLVVDVANVVGSVPDGWWKDRRGATERAIAGVDSLVARGVPASALGLAGHTWHPRVTMVCEGAARGCVGTDRVAVVDAPGQGDDAVVEAARRARDGGGDVTVVTSDRGLASRVSEAGAAVKPTSWLRAMLQ